MHFFVSEKLVWALKQASNRCFYILVWFSLENLDGLLCEVTLYPYTVFFGKILNVTVYFVMEVTAYFVGFLPERNSANS